MQAPQIINGYQVYKIVVIMAYLQIIRNSCKMRNIIFFFLSTYLFSTCYYDSEEDLYGVKACSTTNISFSNDVRPIITSSCSTPCHFSSSSLGGGIVLDTYNAVATVAKNGSLVGSIKHDGFSAMPKGQAKLDDCKISKIEAWVKGGSLNN